MKERLTADEARNLDQDTYVIVKLHEDEYWMQGEGRVSFVTERPSGKVEVGFKGSRGHTSRLHIPADARAGLRLDGAASGANKCRVDAVYKRNS